MPNVVYCIVARESQARAIVDQLRSEGFSAEDISVLFPDRRTTSTFGYEKSSKAPEGATAGAGTGAVLGAVGGWLAGVGALAIPGMGSLIAAGPIMAALSGAAVGGAVGGLTGALIGIGIPEYEAKLYEDRIKSGSILISVRTDDREDTDYVKGIFEAAEAQNISSGSASSVGEDELEDRPGTTAP